MSYGRGGAGNITLNQGQEDLASSVGSRNTVLNSSSKLGGKALQESSSLTVKNEENHASSGRGGAGNLMPSKKSESLPIRTDAARSASRPSPAHDTTSRPRSKPESKPESRAYGRGGAGNFDWANEAEKQHEADLRKKLEQIRQTAEKEVDRVLQKPGKAMLKEGEVEDFGTL